MLLKQLRLFRIGESLIMNHFISYGKQEIYILLLQTYYTLGIKSVVKITR